MYNDYTIQLIWEKATIIKGCNPNFWRQDIAGAWIKRDEYGKKTTFGWEIDHLKPVSLNGAEALSNLQALHWENNETKSNDYPTFYTKISSIGNYNIKKIQRWKVRR